ncbi:MAG: hypothetical protein ABIJ48_09220 [Actinomycetota bacterium]
MTTLELTQTLDDERLAALLPLIDAVWEDGELTDLEIAAVCMALLRHPGVDVGCNEALGRWLDPHHPPTTGEIEALRARLGIPRPATV